MTKRIRNYAELAAHLGIEATEAALSDAVYGATECGAWAKFITGDVTKVVSERWHLTLQPSITGVFVSSVKQGGKWDARRGYRSPEHTPLPQELIDYCLLVRHESNNPNLQGRWKIDELTWGDLQKLVAGNDKEALHDKVLTTTIARVMKVGERQGIMIGSIVEGMDAEADPVRLYFPFTVADFNRAVQAVEDEVDMILALAETEE